MTTASGKMYGKKLYVLWQSTNFLNSTPRGMGETLDGGGVKLAPRCEVHFIPPFL
jgi:hypothetical protein